MDKSVCYAHMLLISCQRIFGVNVRAIERHGGASPLSARKAAISRLSAHIERPSVVCAETAQDAAQVHARVEVNLIIRRNAVPARAIAPVRKNFIPSAYKAYGRMTETYAFTVTRNYLGVHEISVLHNKGHAYGGRRHDMPVAVQRKPGMHADEVLLGKKRQRLQLAEGLLVQGQVFARGKQRPDMPLRS